MKREKLHSEAKIKFKSLSQKERDDAKTQFTAFLVDRAIMATILTEVFTGSVSAGVSWSISGVTSIATMGFGALAALVGTGGLIAIAGGVGLGVLFLGRKIYKHFNKKTFQLSYKINKFDFINSNINIKKEQQNATTKNLFKILKKYVVAKIEQDITDPNKPIKYLYPIYVNGDQYIEYVEQETRELSALEEAAMEDQENLGMISSDLEEYEGVKNLKRNQFHVRFHKNYTFPFRFKGKAYKLDSRTELLLRSKQKKK